MDRAGQQGPLRAWASKREGVLRGMLGDHVALYGEWLWLVHSLSYDRLPDYLLVLDLWSPEHGFLPGAERDGRARAAELPTPPHLLSGVVGNLERLERMTRRSAYSSGPAEGVVLRREHGDGRFDRCKWVRSDFARITDAEWRTGRARNRLARLQRSSW